MDKAGGKPVARKYSPERLASLRQSVTNVEELPTTWDTAQCDRTCMTNACANIIADDESEAPDLLRAVFHDHQPCALDGSLRFELERADNLNLATAAEKVATAAFECECSVADGFAKCAAEALEHTGGPQVKMVWGHKDSGEANPDGNLPPGTFDEGTEGPDVLREVLSTTFEWSDKEIVLLSSAHNIGHLNNQDGTTSPFTTNELQFSNEYFENLKTINDGGEPPENTLQLDSDLALLEDPEFLEHVLRYAGDKKLYFEDFKTMMNEMIGDLSECEA